MLEGKKGLGLSIVVPFFNEEKNLEELYGRLSSVLGGLNKDYEIIFVNDGSTDNTQVVLQDIFKKDERVKVIELRTNFGKTAAMAAGFDYTRGEIVVSMDGDLQDCPEDIPRFIEKI
ncbi:MAG TPA: glycosyltransferase family 2 protein, partial [Candidatus Hypogeohydataceae bacterium YC38]